MAEIYQLPDGNNNNGTNIPFSIPIGFGGMGYGYNNGFGSFGNGIFDIFGLALVASMFGWGGGNGFGGWGNNGGSWSDVHVFMGAFGPKSTWICRNSDAERWSIHQEGCYPTTNRGRIIFHFKIHRLWKKVH
jgi:hypothetical protein